MKTIKRTIRGVEYVAQWKGIAYCDECLEQCKVKGTDRLSNSKLTKIIFKDIIISPKIDVDDYDIETFNEVFEFGKDILFGDFEPKKSKAALKKEVERDWEAYRLIFCDMANYTEDEVFNRMTPQQIKKANIALDIIGEKIKKQTKRKR